MKTMITEFNKLISKGTESQNQHYNIKKKSILMNPSRRAIYEYLCIHPCSLVSSIAKGLNIKESSVRWHLDKLVYERFVTAKENGSVVFFPTQMINPDHIAMFRLMALDKSIDILSMIKSNEGVHQNEISRALELNVRTVMKYLSDLESSGIVRSASDGKYKRFYLTEIIIEIKNYYRKNSKHFKDYVVNKTRADGLRPRILLSSPEKLKLKLDMGTKIRVMTIPMIPFGGEEQEIRDQKKKRLVQKMTNQPEGDT